MAFSLIFTLRQVNWICLNLCRVVDTFLKIKQESNGYPDWCKAELDKTKFKQDYNKAGCIRLDNMEKNIGG